LQYLFSFPANEISEIGRYFEIPVRLPHCFSEIVCQGPGISESLFPFVPRSPTNFLVAVTACLIPYFSINLKTMASRRRRPRATAPKGFIDQPAQVAGDGSQPNEPTGANRPNQSNQVSSQFSFALDRAYYRRPASKCEGCFRPSSPICRVNDFKCGLPA